MSLLMEALRKAEEAKRKSQEQESTAGVDAASVPTLQAEAPRATPSPFTLEPRELKHAHPPEPQAPVPQAAPAEAQAEEPEQAESGRDEIQDYLAGEPVPEDNVPPPRPGRKQRGSRQTRDQLAAASVFAAKQAARKDTRRNKRIMALLGAGITISLVGGIAIWYLQDSSGSGMGINPSIANYDIGNRTLADAPAPPTVSGQETAGPGGEVAASAAPAVQEPAPELAALDPSSAPTQELPEAPSTEAELPASEAIVAVEPPVAAPPAADAAAPAVALAQAASIAAPASTDLPTEAASTAPTVGSRTLEISRSGTRAVVNSTLQSAYNTLQSGDLQAAALLYQEVLAERPTNRDAMIGLAAIRLRTGQPVEARQLYAQLLTLNPQDPYARAGLLQATQGDADPGLEAELKRLLQRYPNLAPLHFALGNFHAGQQRWSEAQSAYFDALLHANRDTLNPVSPDYAFNLAVSLEQLQQPQAALNYYRQALSLSRSSPPGFDPALLQSRLEILEQAQP